MSKRAMSEPASKRVTVKYQVFLLLRPSFLLKLCLRLKIKIKDDLARTTANHPS